MARQRQASKRTGRGARDAGDALSVPAARFKAQCLSLIEQVRQSRRPIIVTRHGQPVAKVVPFQARRHSIVGYSQGTVKILGDIVAPTGVRWDVDAD